jgi:hypothetical protein
MVGIFQDIESMEDEDLYEDSGDKYISNKLKNINKKEALKFLEELMIEKMNYLLIKLNSMIWKR